MNKTKWKKKFGESLTFLMYNRCQILTTIQCVEKVLPEILKEEREKVVRELKKEIKTNTWTLGDFTWKGKIISAPDGFIFRKYVLEALDSYIKKHE